MSQSFKGSAKEVSESTLAVNLEINDIKKNSSKKLLEQKELSSIINLIEELSIQNHYKLNLLKDFSSYNNIKK